MDKRGVYFFVIDAFIGGAIIFVSLILVLSSYSAGLDSEQPLTLLEDFLHYVEQTEVRDFEGNFTQELVENGTIAIPSRTLFEQVGVFHFKGEYSYIQSILGEVAAGALPSQMNIRYSFDGEMLYERAGFPLEESGLALSSRRVSLIAINRTVTYGPHLVEVIVWTS